MKIIEKAFGLDSNRIVSEFPYHYNIFCYAENRNKAKLKLLDLVKHSDIRLNFSHDKLSYLNIPVIRYKSLDKVVFEDEIVTRNIINDIIAERNRIAKLIEIANDDNIKYCYIIKDNYYRENYSGYTSLRHEAGVYDKKDAIDCAKSVRDIILKPVDIENHNMMIINKIIELQGRLL